MKLYMLAGQNGVWTEDEVLAGIRDDNAEREFYGLPLRTAADVWADFVEVVPNRVGESGYDPAYADYRPAN